MKSGSIIFFGTDDLSLTILQTMVDHGHNIAAVITKPDQPSQRTRQPAMSVVKRYALASNLTIWQPTSLTAISDDIQKLTPTAGLVVSYGKIIPPTVLSLFPTGLVNVHPSLLPKYRGPSPGESAILSGDTSTGVSLMQLDEQMDHGPIYAQAPFKLSGRETSPQLYHQLGAVGAELLLKHWPDIISGRLRPHPQDHSAATYSAMITKADGRIDWQQPADHIERQVRAYLGWPGSHTDIEGRHVIITESHVLSQSGPAGKVFWTKDLLGVYCGQLALSVDRLKPAGRNEMTAKAFLAGLHSAA